MLNEKIQSLLMPIKESTGLDVEIYSPRGERMASTCDTELAVVDLLPEVDNDAIVEDAPFGVTVFDVNLNSKHCVGVIRALGEEGRNYAYLTAKLLESGTATYGRTLDRTDEFRMLLEGELSRPQIEQFKLKYPGVRSYYVLVFLCAKKAALREYLRDLCQESDYIVPMSGKGVVVMKDAESLAEYRSAADFAHMVCDNVEQELGLHPEVGVGDLTRRADDVPQSFRQALDALRLGKLFDGNAQVYSHKDYFLINLFEELPRDRIRRILESGVDANAAEIFEDAEMMETAEQFLLGSLNISETARVMYMHRNTLIYRLDKIEKSTGLNIRRFADAMTFRMLSMLYKLNKRSGI